MPGTVSETRENWSQNYSVSESQGAPKYWPHLSFARSDDEPVTVKGDDRDREGREEDGDGEGGPHDLAQDEGLDAEGPVLCQDVDERHRRREDAQREVGQRQRRDKRVSRRSHFYNQLIF